MKATATAKLNNLRMSPRKVRLLADAVRKKGVKEALLQLQFSNKDAALPVMKLLRSAIANADHNYNMDIESLTIKTIYVDGGPTLHRWMPRAFGRASKIRKRTSHITLIVEGDIDEKTKRNKDTVVKNKEIYTKEKQEPVVKKNNITTKELKAPKHSGKGSAGIKQVSTQRTTQK